MSPRDSCAHGAKRRARTPWGERVLIGQVAVLVLASCESSSKSPAKKDAPAVAIVGDAAAVVDAVARKLFITGAGRCGECHEKMYDEWETSAHAKAASSPLYKASVAAATKAEAAGFTPGAGNDDKTCDRCHAPLAALALGDIVATEGVTCDVCHTLREPSPSKAGGSFRLAVDDMVKFGPRCDLADHYFHRMGCSPEHEQAAICGSCHWWEPNGVPVFTEYADWKAGPQAAEGTQCQDCHMPDERAVLATGSPVRTGVSHHGLLGIARDLRTRALGLDVKVSNAGDKLAIAIVVRNNNAGHAVPAGLPERRVVVRATLRDAAGKDVALEQRALGRRLVDGSGAEVPFWRATRVDGDTRIQVGGQWTETLSLPSASTGTVQVDVVYRGLSDAAARELAITEVEEHPMVHATIKLGGGLPKSVSVKPPAPGKRTTPITQKARK